MATGDEKNAVVGMLSAAIISVAIFLFILILWEWTATLLR